MIVEFAIVTALHSSIYMQASAFKAECSDGSEAMAVDEWKTTSRAELANRGSQFVDTNNHGSCITIIVPPQGHSWDNTTTCRPSADEQREVMQ